jgi:NodT family efflux transporter outer membrane factor (OMF) lipoprotein
MTVNNNKHINDPHSLGFDVIKLFLWITLSLLLVSCNSSGNETRADFVRSTKSENAFKRLGHLSGHSDVSWPTRSWWEELKSKELNTLINQALDSNQVVKKAYDNLMESEALVGVAEARLLPSIQSDLLFRQSRNPFRGTVASYNPAQGGLYKSTGFLSPFVMNWEIDFWGKNRAAFNAAIGDVAAQQAELDQVRLVITCALARAYIRGIILAKQYKIAHDIVAQRQQAMDVNLLRHETGIDTLDGAASARANLDTAKRREVVLEGAIGLQRDAIARMIGTGPDNTIGLFSSNSSNLPGRIIIPKKIPIQSLSKRPDLAAAMARAYVWSNRIHVAKTMFLPSLDLSIAAGIEGTVTTTRNMNKLSDWLFNTQAIGFSAVPGLKLPIFQGGRLSGNLDMNRAEYDQAVDSYNETLLQAVQQSADSLVNLKRVNSEYDIQNDYLIATRQQYDLADIRIKQGMRDSRELLQERIDILEAHFSLLNIESDRHLAAVDLIQAMGGGYSGNYVDINENENPENDPITPAVKTVRELTGG